MASLLEAQATTWVCDWHLKLGRGILVELSPPLTCGIECYFQVHNIRVVLNYRTPAGVPTIGWWCVGRNLPHSPRAEIGAQYTLTSQISFSYSLFHLSYDNSISPVIRLQTSE